MSSPTPPAPPSAASGTRTSRRAPAARSLARRWPALAGAALVTALLPLGVALADDFNDPSVFNASVDFNKSVRMFGTLKMLPLSSSGITLDVGTSDTAVRAQGTNVVGVGVDASGGKIGVKATSATGNAVEASGKGAGVFATASDGTGVIGSAQGQFGTGVVGNGTRTGGQFTGQTGSGVVAQSRDDEGVFASSEKGLGGRFSGGKAPIRLVPAAASGAPPAASGAHQPGELYVDSAGQLFICTAAGTPGTWVKVGAQQ